MKLPIKELKANPDNPRLIKDEKYKRLVQSLKDFPEMADVREVVVNKDKVILGGNMRYKAMQEAGWKEVPVKIVDWPEDKQKEFVIKDNSSFGEWDWDAIANQYELEDLEAWGIDLPVQLQSEEVEEDEAPPVSVEPAASQLGQIYQLGRHRVMCGDSTDKENIEQLMNGEKASLVFTDPPYGMFLDADYSGMEGISKGNRYENVIGDHDDFKPELITSVFDNFGYCKDIFMWGADYYSELIPNRNAGSWVVWDKMQGGEGVNDNYDKMFGSNFELCWSKARHKRAIARVLWKGIFGLGAEDTSKRVHPTQKPVKLSDWFIQKFTKKEDIIADVYLGGGSTLIACEQTDRTCYGMELDPKYVDVIRKRYAKFTNDNELPENWEELSPVIESVKKA